MDPTLVYAVLASNGNLFAQQQRHNMEVDQLKMHLNWKSTQLTQLKDDFNSLLKEKERESAVSEMEKTALKEQVTELNKRIEELERIDVAIQTDEAVQVDMRCVVPVETPEDVITTPPPSLLGFISDSSGCSSPEPSTSNHNHHMAAVSGVRATPVTSRVVKKADKSVYIQKMPEKSPLEHSIRRQNSQKRGRTGPPKEIRAKKTKNHPSFDDCQNASNAFLNRLHQSRD